MATNIFTHLGTRPEFRKRAGIQAFAAGVGQASCLSLTFLDLEAGDSREAYPTGVNFLGIAEGLCQFARHFDEKCRYAKKTT